MKIEKIYGFVSLLAIMTKFEITSQCFLILQGKIYNLLDLFLNGDILYDVHTVFYNFFNGLNNVIYQLIYITWFILTIVIIVIFVKHLLKKMKKS